jgi:hypothetical protein
MGLVSHATFPPDLRVPPSDTFRNGAIERSPPVQENETTCVLGRRAMKVALACILLGVLLARADSTLVRREGGCVGVHLGDARAIECAGWSAVMAKATTVVFEPNHDEGTIVVKSHGGPFSADDLEDLRQMVEAVSPTDPSMARNVRRVVEWAHSLPNPHALGYAPAQPVGVAWGVVVLGCVGGGILMVLRSADTGEFILFHGRVE